MINIKQFFSLNSTRFFYKLNYEESGIWVMPSDSSDDDHDVYFLDYPNCVDEDKNQIVGLIVEDHKFRRGDKGKITTTHCNLRVLLLFRFYE